MGISSREACSIPIQGLRVRIREFPLDSNKKAPRRIKDSSNHYITEMLMSRILPLLLVSSGKWLSHIPFPSISTWCAGHLNMLDGSELNQSKFISVSVAPMRNSAADDPTKHCASKSCWLEAPIYPGSLYVCN
jgi:hypothetical protein